MAKKNIKDKPVNVTLLYFTLLLLFVRMPRKDRSRHEINVRGIVAAGSTFHSKISSMNSTLRDKEYIFSECRIN
jgi:hypothetical protein